MELHLTTDRKLLQSAVVCTPKAATASRLHIRPGFRASSGRFALLKKAGVEQALYPTRMLRCQANPTNKEAIMLNKPMSMLDVDPELWQALDLCSDDELEVLYKLLHSRSPFSPVLKSLVLENEPALVEKRGRLSIMHKVESEFRFLAADSATLLRGKRPAYRDTLLRIIDRLDIQCSSNLTSPDLEIEIYWHILNNCAEYMQSQEEEDAAQGAPIAGDMSSIPRSTRTAGGNWTERLTAPLKFGVKEIMETLAKVGGVVTVSAGQRAAAQLGTQVLCQQLRYQSAVQAATLSSRSALAVWQKQAMLQGAHQQLAVYTAKYSAARGVLSFLGPAMWAWLITDLALKAVGTDYARVINAVFMLAQVRLYRTHGFVNPDPSEFVEPDLFGDCEL